MRYFRHGKWLIVSIILMLSCPLAFAQTYTNPLIDGATRNGVMSCYGSTCHSRQAATGAKVRQNEILIWQAQDDISGVHSRAYAVLLNSRSQKIARNLGIGPAHEAPECLTCHADNVPAGLHGEKFSISEGVTCESCHGGSENWLTSHYAPGRTHEQNLADGLYPTDDPIARAELCLGCHLGSKRENQFVTHRIMGAGHPRMSFELDLFTSLQQHHDVDADYRERKKVAGGVKTWAIGQAMALEQMLDLFSDARIGREGVFPELYFFDCHACHQTISNAPDWQPTWRPNPGRSLGPGAPVFNDANIIMLNAAVRVMVPEMEGELRSATRSFHLSISEDRGSPSAATTRLKDVSSRLARRMSEAEFSSTQAKQILSIILADSLSAQYTDYAAAEQAVIAVDTFLNALVVDNAVSIEQAINMRPLINEAYASVDQPNTYNQSRLRRALRNISQQMGQI